MEGGKKQGEKENMTRRIKSKVKGTQVSERQHNSSPRCTIHSELTSRDCFFFYALSAGLVLREFGGAAGFKCLIMTMIPQKKGAK